MRWVFPAMLLMSTGPAAAQSTEPVPGIPTNSGTVATWVVNTYVGPYCNKVDLANGQTWAISAADWNASGRWEQIMALYILELSGHGQIVSFLSSADPKYTANIPVSPVTYCSGSDGVTHKFANPASISPGATYK